MNVFITGARQGVNPQVLSNLIALVDWDIVTVVTSDRGGVDAWARQWAVQSNKPLVVLPTQWSSHGRQAAHIRNTAALEMSQMCMLFADWTCPYCKALADQATRFSIPTYIQTLETP